MPSTSLAAPKPGAVVVTTEPTAVLRKQVSADGLCVPATVHVASAVYRVSEDNDRWFPVTEAGEEAVKHARWACSGCPVIAECLELALREEGELGDVYGVRGGVSAGARKALIAKRRGVR